MRGSSGLRRLGFRAVVPAVVVGGAVTGTIVHRALNNRGENRDLRDLRELRPLDVEEFTFPSTESASETTDVDSVAVDSVEALVPFDAVVEPEGPVVSPVSNPRRIWSRLFATMVTLSVPLAGIFVARHVAAQESVSVGDHHQHTDSFEPRDVPQPNEIPPHAVVEEGDPVACLPEDTRRFVRRCLIHLAYFEVVGVCPFCERDTLDTTSFETVVFEVVPLLFRRDFELVPSAVFDPHFWEPLCYYTLFQDMLVCKCGKHDRYHVVKTYPVMDVHPLNTVYMLFIVKEGFDEDRGYPVMSSFGYHIGWAFEPLGFSFESLDDALPSSSNNGTGR
uniref:p37 n=1 Tax=Japanese holly fern mottle virus TaxID=659660 RepID=C7T503_9VIRU|nr:p37 [Japanese holly fern mottle virus]